MMRSKSFGLLAAPLGILLLGMVVLFLKDHPDGNIALSMLGDLAYLPGMVLAIVMAAGIQFFLIRSNRQWNVWLFPCTMFLASIGLVMVARLKPALLTAQLRWVILGMLIFLAVLQWSGKIIRAVSYQYLMGLCCLVVLCLPLLFGTEIGGSRNWLVMGPVQVQPSEFGKILLVLFLAGFLSAHRNVLRLPNRRLFFLQLPPLRFIAPLLCIWGIAILMFVVQRDLGSALLFFGIAILMTYIATGNRSYVMLALGVIGLAAVLSYQMFSHVKVRFDIWLDPWQDPNGMAYQVVQSLFAFGSGGIWGTGFTHGHPGLIPEVHTDFIFAAIAEEFGLVGSLMVLLVYVVFFYEGVKIALACEREVEVLLAMGCNIVFFLQAFIILAGVTKFLPLTGITLPFVSYGGSSMVSGFILLGILVSLSRREKNHA